MENIFICSLCDEHAIILDLCYKHFVQVEQARAQQRVELSMTK